MSTLLTVAIPTYNRAALLERQLAWLSRDLRGLASQCELLISDNASTDTTPEVIRRWAGTLGSARLRLVRQKTNVGAVRNIAFCIGAATGRHVWTISDDDPIGEGTLSSVLHLLRSHPELALLVLNFSSRRAGQLLMERCFEVS